MGRNNNKVKELLKVGKECEFVCISDCDIIGYKRFLLHTGEAACTQSIQFPTSRETVPDLQAVKPTVDPSGRLCVRLQLKALELQDDFRHFWGEDHKCAVQVIRVLLRETR